MSAAVQLDPMACQHGDFRVYDARGGATLDDHVSERGYCAGCRSWLGITTWRTRDEIDVRALRAEEISLLKLFAQGKP